MKRPFECTATITIALIFSLCFTGQRPSQGNAKIGVNVAIVAAENTGSQNYDEPDDLLKEAIRETSEPTEEETLVKSYIERDLSLSDDVSIIDDRDRADFTVTLFVVNPKYSSVVPKSPSGELVGLRGKCHRDTQ